MKKMKQLSINTDYVDSREQIGKVFHLKKTLISRAQCCYTRGILSVP